MPPRKRARSAETSASAAPSVAPAISLTGGHAEKPRTIDCYRAAQHVDVEVRAADGTAFQAHSLVLMAGSDYFAAAYSGGWADASGPLKLSVIASDAVEACIEWIYTGECSAADDSRLCDLLRAAAYLQIGPLLEAAAEVLIDHEP